MVLVLLAELHREYQLSLVGFVLGIAGIETKQTLSLVCIFRVFLS